MHTLNNILHLKIIFMTKEQIAVYARQITLTHQPTIVTFKDKTEWVGFFNADTENPADEANNEWSFVPFKQDDMPKKKFHFNGDDVINIEIKNKDLV